MRRRHGVAGPERNRGRFRVAIVHAGMRNERRVLVRPHERIESFHGVVIAAANIHGMSRAPRFFGETADEFPMLTRIRIVHHVEIDAGHAAVTRLPYPSRRATRSRKY